MREDAEKSSEHSPQHLAQPVLELGRLCMKFARTDRLIHSDRDGTPESDTDHTFMLALISGAIAADYLPELDHTKVIEFALIHDLPEVIAGDVATINISDEDYQAKQAKEEEAIEILGQAFDTDFPWITKTIRDYESLDTPEARFVKIMDKVMPSILHFDNGGFSLAFHGVETVEKVDSSTQKTTARIEAYNYDQPLATNLWQEFIDKIKRELFDDGGKLKIS
ncbi:MAG TPA: HD domain-containing protein [Candidatus Saccharimonadales bacterium]|jgi:putative hydrolase of HD superfamily